MNEQNITLFQKVTGVEINKFFLVHDNKKLVRAPNKTLNSKVSNTLNLSELSG